MGEGEEVLALTDEECEIIWSLDGTDHAKLRAAFRIGARRALSAVIAEDVHTLPMLPPPDAPKHHGPCHPSDPNRQCAAHRVLGRIEP